MQPRQSGPGSSIEQIRSHLGHITKMFSSGNFKAPMFIHDTNPPGTATMTRLKELGCRKQKSFAQLGPVVFEFCLAYRQTVYGSAPPAVHLADGSLFRFFGNAEIRK